MPLARYQQPWEHRPGMRIRASYPIVFEWQTKDGELRRSRGTTHDISAGGVYCYLDQALPEGLEVKFNTIFPAELATGEPSSFVCAGRVLRSCSLGRHYGLGVKIEDLRPIQSETAAGKPNWRVQRRVMPFVSVPAVYSGHRSIIRNLSDTGAYIEDDRPLPVGREVEVHLGGEGAVPEIRLRAMVRRMDSHLGMAVEFIAVSQEAHRRLLHFLEKCRHQ